MFQPSQTAPSACAERLPVIDALRASAALLIVLHHFSLYGPLARGLAQRLPQVSQWLVDYGRFAVYVFLVVAGFMAARAFIDLSARPTVPAIRLIVRRYLRLALPLSIALLLAVFCAALARHWSTEDYIPAAPSTAQVLAHLGLLQGVLGFESLSTGVWYVAVELQLFAVVVLLLKLRSGLPGRGLPAGAIALLALSSWLWWHGDPALDNWAPYFFGAYGLGILAWSADGARLQSQRLLRVLAVTGAAAVLALDWRGRMAVALVTALALSRVGLRPTLWGLGEGALRWLGERSYALFLVHFPVILLLNTLLDEVPAITAMPPLLPLAAGLGVSIAAAAVFHVAVELPCMRLLRMNLPPFPSPRRILGGLRLLARLTLRRQG